MKRIKKIMIIISLLLYTTASFTQANYYTATKTFNQNEYTYQCDVVQGSGMVTLHNKDNKLTYTDQIYRATGEEPPLFQDFDDLIVDYKGNLCQNKTNEELDFALNQIASMFETHEYTDDNIYKYNWNIKGLDNFKNLHELSKNC